MVAATNSNFLRILPEALHTNRTMLSTALAVALWLNAICVPIGGRLVDRFGLRKVVLPGIVLFSIAYLLLSQVTNAWEFLLVQILIAVPVSMHASPAYAKLISLWFDRHRGFVLGLAVALGAGLGQTIMPKVTQALINTYGWRGGFIGIALIVLAIGFPAVALLARTPKAMLVADHAASSGEQAETEQRARFGQQGYTRGEALRQRTFYQLFAAIMFGSMALLATMAHAVPLLTERGLSVSDATTVMSCAFAGVIVGQFSSGFVIDRLNTPRVLTPYFASALIGVVILYSAHDKHILLPAAVMMGLGLGGEISQNAYLVSRYFGLKAFGAIYGLTFAASALGNGTGVILLGYLRDLSGSYDICRYLTGGAMTAALICVTFLPKFVFSSPKAAAR
ncbi:MAG: hypothetical protein DI605_05220 [Sphingomonas sp.]|nr:MAG: hypothetical protein DI605_05220 [Sphingomonas sp.]